MVLNKIASTLIIFIATVVILIYGQSLLIPFLFALLLWFLVRKIKSQLDKVGFIKNKFPSWSKSLITSILLFFILWFISTTLSSSIRSLMLSYKIYESNILLITDKINESLGINLMDILKTHAGDINFGALLGSLINSLTYIISNAFMILLYAIFIFLEETHFSYKLQAIISSEDRRVMVNEILGKIEKSIADYIGLKTLINLIGGILSYIVLLIIGVDAPVFWASLIFLFNFIPTIGSLAGTAFPAIFSLIQFGTFTPCLLVLIFIGLIQLLVGNFLEPKLMGNSLNISILITILALAFWGTIWGITGMILSVPITVIMVIIFSQFENTKPIAIMLSEKGKL
jgi:AI-2 transport protein TqsA